MTREEAKQASDWFRNRSKAVTMPGARRMYLLAIEALSAQPQRKKGKWINHRKDDGHNIADCDQCGNAIQWFDGDKIPRYCCMCGADMRTEENDDN